MMHRCGGSQGNMVGPCSCDLYHHHQHHSQSYSSSSSSPPSSFSMLFSMPNHQHHYRPYDLDHLDHHDHDDDHDQTYSFGAGGGVDCTLSLGTPSTRLCAASDADYAADADGLRRSGSRGHVSSFCWDLLQPKQYSSSGAAHTTSSHKNGVRGGNNNNNNNNSNGNNNDPLVARRCANCDTTSTPLWRNGPRGPKSLCNACGIRFKKEERRATAAAASPASAMGQPSHVLSHHHHHHQYHHSINPWNNFPHSQAPKIPNCLSSASEFRFMDVVDDMAHHDASAAATAADTGISFLSWRLNVTDRPSLVHDFTR